RSSSFSQHVVCFLHSSPGLKRRSALAFRFRSRLCFTTSTKDTGSPNLIMGGVLSITAGAPAIAQATAPHHEVHIFTAAITNRATITMGQHGHRATTERAGLAMEAGNGEPDLLSFKVP